VVRKERWEVFCLALKNKKKISKEVIKKIAKLKEKMRKSSSEKESAIKKTEVTFTGLEGRKAVVLFENSDGIFTMHKVTVKNGEVNVGKLAWYVGEFPPFGWIKTMFGYTPFWIVNYRSALPIMRKDVVDPSEFSKITPQMLGTILELKILHFLLKRIRKLPGTTGDYTSFLIALFGGMILMYLLIHFGIITV